MAVASKKEGRIGSEGWSTMKKLWMRGWGHGAKILGLSKHIGYSRNSYQSLCSLVGEASLSSLTKRPPALAVVTQNDAHCHAMEANMTRAMEATMIFSTPSSSPCTRCGRSCAKASSLLRLRCMSAQSERSHISEALPRVHYLQGSVRP
jgi:hypothetical protein